jgi:hypothetical protein
MLSCAALRRLFILAVGKSPGQLNFVDIRRNFADKRQYFRREKYWV